MLIPFTKMQAQGNDFVILELMQNTHSQLDLPALAIDVCQRRKGVGADGLVLLLGDPDCDARMAIINSDGSAAAMCGSALRCCAWLLHGLIGKAELRVNTDSGIKAAVVGNAGVEVNLGAPRLVGAGIEVLETSGTLVDVGNLHYVAFGDVQAGQEAVLGPLIEAHPRFPGRVNVQFARVVSRSELELRIWEKGAGATQACGTGAVASVFAGIQMGGLDPEVRVRMPGGEVRVRSLENGEYMLQGSVEEVFTGVYRWKI